jgi:hypothetical protein
MGEAVLSAVVDSSPTTGQKLISIRALLETPVRRELHFSIDASIIGDWVVSHRKIVLEGKVGRKSERVLKLRGYKEVVKHMEVSSTNGISVSELPPTDDEERAFLISSIIQTSFGESLLGTVYVKSPSGLPELEKVAMFERGSLSSAWSEPIVELRQENSSRLELLLDADDEFLSLDTTHGIEWKQIEQTEDKVVFDITMKDAEVAADSRIAEVVANMRFRESPFRIPCRVIVTGAQ